ncbi:MAG: TonB-dependent receptor [Sinobacteraceae bacterium]|nr:TonB-dependent receptor [Nevskiaceae bacterium]
MLLCLPPLGVAQATSSASPADNSSDAWLLPQITVVGSTPLVGSELDRDRIPKTTQTLGSTDVNRTGIPSLTAAILENVASITINDTEGNLFQPDILFRGFTASPVAGTPQGLAIYVNGARFNDPFGDTVNWDLIPSIAIDSVALESANPLFGLNALGGSLSVRLKNGFSTQSAEAIAYGGSYGRAGITLEVGRQFGSFAVYASGDATHDNGFRQTSTSNLYRLYLDLGWRVAGGEWHLALTGARTTLGNPGATPEQALVADISNIFTAPNVVRNTYSGFNLNGNQSLGTAAIQTLAYFQTLQQVIPNGTTVQVAPCDDGSNLLCNDDGAAVTTFNNQPVSDFLHGGPYSGLSVQQLSSHAYGASAELTENSKIAGLPNNFLGGASFDGSYNTFAGAAQIGGFDPFTREFLGPGVVQAQPSEGVNPVRVKSDTRFYGVYFSDVLTVIQGVNLNIAGRYNDAQVDLEDLLGGPVNGKHMFDRFNPSAGLTWRVLPQLQLYGSYAQTNRAPTPLELSCASAANPCSLLNFFVGDPNLKQVVAHSYEVGLRGHGDEQSEAKWSWNIDVYRTQNTHDIIFETTAYNPNLAFYSDAGRTLRRGAEANMRLQVGALDLRLGYAYTQAKFDTALLLSTNSPAADANGDEQVSRGARIPGIPLHRGTAIVEYAVTDRLRVGGSLVIQSNVYRFGDEANLTRPLGGYGIVDLDASFRPLEHVTLFASVNNVFNRRYYTYGSFGPVGDVPWPNIPGGVTDPSTASPGTPLTAYGGVRIAW